MGGTVRWGVGMGGTVAWGRSGWGVDGGLPASGAAGGTWSLLGRVGGLGVGFGIGRGP